MNCEHKFVHFDTLKSKDYSGHYHIYWKRVDKFFCEKCLEYKDKITDGYSRDKPEWY
jgi:hypothetical protein